MGTNTSVSPAIAEEPMQLFPNPSHDFIHVSSTLAGTIRIFNLKGELVLEKANSNTQTSIECLEWPAGVYLVQFTDKTNHTFTKKFIKQ
jgi:hypothetical protein